MNAENWKWWYWVAIGLLIGAYSIYQISTGLISKGVGGVVLALVCIVFGLFSRK